METDAVGCHPATEEVTDAMEVSVMVAELIIDVTEDNDIMEVSDMLPVVLLVLVEK
jgi:hypothetical protein